MAAPSEDNFEAPILDLERRIESLSGMGDDAGIQRQREQLLRELDEVREKVFSSLTPWQKALVARHARRPYTLDYIGFFIEDFIETHLP